MTNIMSTRPQEVAVAGRELLSSFGCQVLAGILPGVVIAASFFLSPHDFLLLGPTAFSLFTMGLVLVVALPYHNYRQFQLLTDDAPREEAGRSRPDALEMDGPRYFADANPQAKTPRVAELEKELRRRLNLDEPGDRHRRRVVEVRLDLGFLSDRQRLRLERAYADLDLPPGASIEEVRRSYRRIMRVFHPDQYRQAPQTHRLAAELARLLASSYTTIVSTLMN